MSLHSSSAKSAYANIGITGVWNVLAVAHKYGLDPKAPEAKAWFKGRSQHVLSSEAIVLYNINLTPLDCTLTLEQRGILQTSSTRVAA